MNRTSELHELLNKERRKRKLPWAKWDQNLWKGCKAQSNHMLKSHRLFHARQGLPNGGECVFGGRGYHPPRAIVKSWMRSRAHAALILNPSITRQAVSISRNRYGTYSTWRGVRSSRDYGVTLGGIWNSYVIFFWIVIILGIIALFITQC